MRGAEGISATARAASVWEGVRDHFPTLLRREGDCRIVYLDTAATALRPEAVIEEEAEFYRSRNASVHRGLYGLAEEATEAYEGARAAVASWVGAPSPNNVVFTRNATAALNLVARGLDWRFKSGDEVLLSAMEHHSNIVPWLQLAQRRGVRVRYLPLDDDGRLDLSQLSRMLSHRTKAVSLTLVSNVLGTINPVAEVAEAAHRVGAVMIVDGAQAAGRLPLAWRDLGADVLVFSAHKCYGPMGLGCLIGASDFLDRLEPLEGGGQMVDEVSWEGATWTAVPYRFEAGTSNAAAAVAFPPALSLMTDLDLSLIHRHEQELVAYGWERLSTLGDMRLLGPPPPEPRGGLMSFVDKRVHPHDGATLLAERGIAVRAGHHCAQPLHRTLGEGASLRASFGVYTTTHDIDRLIDGLEYARKVLT